MTARVMWKARLRFRELTIPVGFYAAAQDRNVHFHLLHATDGVRVQQRMVDPRTGEEVPPSERRKGVEFERGRFVLLRDEELEGLEPKASRDVALGPFVPRGTLDHRWYERPYWLGPDGPATEYHALAKVLADEQLDGFARWVMRKRSYAGALRAHEGHLLLFSLRHAGEVISTRDLGSPSGRAADPKELRLAEQLVAALADEFDPTAFADEYRGRVLSLIEAKRSGKRVERAKEAPPRASRKSMRSLLEASLEEVGAGGGKR